MSDCLASQTILCVRTDVGLPYSVLVLTVASELAVATGTVRGPGTFLPALIDNLSTISGEDVQKIGKIEVFQ